MECTVSVLQILPPATCCLPGSAETLPAWVVSWLEYHRFLRFCRRYCRFTCLAWVTVTVLFPAVFWVSGACRYHHLPSAYLGYLAYHLPAVSVSACLPVGAPFLLPRLQLPGTGLGSACLPACLMEHHTACLPGVEVRRSACTVSARLPCLLPAGQVLLPYTWFYLHHLPACRIPPALYTTLYRIAMP